MTGEFIDHVASVQIWNGSCDALPGTDAPTIGGADRDWYTDMTSLNLIGLQTTQGWTAGSERWLRGFPWMKPQRCAFVAGPGLVLGVDAGPATWKRAGGWVVGTPILPLTGASVVLYQFGNWNQTPLLDEFGELQVIAPDCGSQVVRLGVEPVPTDDTELNDALPPSAVQAVADISDWLRLSSPAAVELCGVSLRAYRYWTSGDTVPRQRTVHHLFDVHAFLSQLFDRLGYTDARLWLVSAPTTQTGGKRLELLHDEAGLRQLLRDAGNLIFAAGRQAEDPSPEITGGLADEYQVATPTTPPRRPRRLST
jgi:hypothetical protein